MVLTSGSMPTGLRGLTQGQPLHTQRSQEAYNSHKKCKTMNQQGRPPVQPPCSTQQLADGLCCIPPSVLAQPMVTMGSLLQAVEP